MLPTRASDPAAPVNCPHCRRELAFMKTPAGPDSFRCNFEDCHGGYPRPEYQFQARLVRAMAGPEKSPLTPIVDSGANGGQGEVITLAQFYDRYAIALALEAELMIKFGVT